MHTAIFHRSALCLLKLTLLPMQRCRIPSAPLLCDNTSFFYSSELIRCHIVQKELEGALMNSHMHHRCTSKLAPVYLCQLIVLNVCNEESNLVELRHIYGPSEMRVG